MSLDKRLLKQDLMEVMRNTPNNKNSSDTWQQGWMNALEKYIKSGVPTPALFNNQDGDRSLLRFEASNSQASITNISTAISTYISMLTTPTDATATINNAIDISSVLTSTIMPTTSDVEYDVLVNAIDVWVKSVTWVCTVPSGVVNASLV